MEDKPVSMCMSTDAETVSPDTPLVETLLILYHARHSLPVVDPDNGKLVGVVSYWDAGEKILST
jgi:CBS-domain-containing membrane protein